MKPHCSILNIPRNPRFDVTKSTHIAAQNAMAVGVSKKHSLTNRLYKVSETFA